GGAGGGGGAARRAVVGGLAAAVGRGPAGRAVEGVAAVEGGAVSGGAVEAVGSSVVSVVDGASARPTARRRGESWRPASAVPPTATTRTTAQATARIVLLPRVIVPSTPLGLDRLLC